MAASDELPLPGLGGPHPPTERGTFELDIDPDLDRADIAALCERVRDLVERTDANRLVCDVGAILDPDAVTVDALARLQLTARRLGRQVRLAHASPELRDAARAHGAERRRAAQRPIQASRWAADRTAGRTWAVSRKKLIPLIRPPDISSDLERPRLVAAAGRSACTGRTPASRSPSIGIRREPRQPIPGPRHHLTDVEVGLEPQLVRRHRPRRVLVEQRRQRVHVVALERVDVAGEERPLLVVHRLGRVVAAIVLRGERRPGSLEGAVDRRDGRVEELRDLGRLPPQDLAQDEHGPLARRQVLQRGDEREADRLARDRHARPGRRPPAATRPSGIGSIQVSSGSAAPSGVSAVCAGPRSIGRARRCAPAQHVEADVGRDAIQPRPQRRAALEAIVGCATPAPAFPGRRPPPRTPSRASGSSSAVSSTRYSSSWAPSASASRIAGPGAPRSAAATSVMGRSSPSQCRRRFCTGIDEAQPRTHLRGGPAEERRRATRRRLRAGCSG